MIALRRHTERHRTERISWLRAAVLGANDGIVSTASLLVGVAAANAGRGALLITGVSGLIAGALSMAAGEYVSVQSQADVENADLLREAAELRADPAAEQRELTSIYVSRGLSPQLAHQVAEQLTAHDALAAHARDELGISAAFRARPILAAVSSSASFAAGAALPLVVALLAPAQVVIYWVGAMSLGFLALLGYAAAQAGGASRLAGAWRVTVWGALAMAITAGVGSLFDASI